MKSKTLIVIILFLIIAAGFYFYRNYYSSSPTTSPQQSLAYTNQKYNFQINFPENWREYRVRERKIGGTIPYIEFGLPKKIGAGLFPSVFAQEESDYVFGIAVYSKNDWEQAQTGVGTRPAVLQKTGETYLSYGVETAVINTASGKDVPTILNSSFPLSLGGLTETYRNDKFGFSIQYPAGFQAKVEHEDYDGIPNEFLRVAFGPSGLPSVLVLVEIGGDLDDLAEDFKSGMELMDTYTKTTFQGNPAITMEGWTKIHPNDTVSQEINMLAFTVGKKVYAVVNIHPLTEEIFPSIINSIKTF